MTTMAEGKVPIDASAFIPFISPKGGPARSGELAPIEERASEQDMKKIP
jgi:hypothetical protein